MGEDKFAESLRAKGVSEKDINATHSQFMAISTLDGLVFEEKMRIRVIAAPPMQSSDAHCGYLTDSYVVFAKGLDDEIEGDIRYGKSKEHGFKPEHHKYVTRDVILWANAARLVRYRVQGYMGVGLLRPEDASKTPKDLELLQEALKRLAYIFKPGQEETERQFDADVISAYARAIAIEAKMENLDNKGIAWQLSQIVKFDGRLLDHKKRGICFVATAVYQNPNAEQVEQYRWLRDNVLSRTNVGNRFIDWYESGGGQRLADIVERHPILRVPSKATLDVGAYAIRAIKYVKEKAA